MAKFPGEAASGLAPVAAPENPDASGNATGDARGQAGLRALEIARAESHYLVATKQIGDRLAGETEPDRLRETYQPLYKRAFDDSAGLISDPQQRDVWAQTRAGDLEGNISATADRALGLTREREIAGAGAQLETIRRFALETDPARRAEFIQAANGLITGLHMAGHIGETQAQEQQKAWAGDFALAAFSKLPAAERVKLLSVRPQGEGGKGELVDLVPEDKRESLLQAAKLDLRNEELAAQSAAALERHKTEERIRDDLASILKDGKGVGDLASGQVGSALGPEVLRRWQETREDFNAIRSHTDDLHTLTEQAIEERLRSLAPNGNPRDDPRKTAVYYAVQEVADEIRRLRLTDPAKSVEDDPAVRAARDYQGEPDDPQAPRNLYAARLAAQTRAGIDREAQSPITKEEALALIARLRDAEPGQERDILGQVGESFRVQFGADAERAFAFALRAQKSDTQEIIATTQMLKAMRSRDDAVRAGDPQPPDAPVFANDVMAEDVTGESVPQSGPAGYAWSTMAPEVLVRDNNAPRPFGDDPLFGWDAIGSRERERGGLDVAIAGLMAASGGGRRKNIGKAILDFFRGVPVTPPPPEAGDKPPPREPPPDITPVLPSEPRRVEPDAAEHDESSRALEQIPLNFTHSLHA